MSTTSLPKVDGSRPSERTALRFVPPPRKYVPFIANCRRPPQAKQNKSVRQSSFSSLHHRPQIPGYTGFRRGMKCVEVLSEPTKILGIETFTADASMSLSANVYGGYRMEGFPQCSHSQSVFVQHPIQNNNKQFNRNLGTIPGIGNFSNCIDLQKGNGALKGKRIPDFGLSIF